MKFHFLPLYVCTSLILFSSSSSVFFVSSAIFHQSSPSLSTLLQNKFNSAHKSNHEPSFYKISPKPCTVTTQENELRDGTCMFVWECLKSNGKHLGMCKDGFMFGSCCSNMGEIDEVKKKPPLNFEFNNKTTTISTTTSTTTPTPTTTSSTTTTSTTMPSTTFSMTTKRPTSAPMTSSTYYNPPYRPSTTTTSTTTTSTSTTTESPSTLPLISSSSSHIAQQQVQQIVGNRPPTPTSTTPQEVPLVTAEDLSCGVTPMLMKNIKQTRIVGGKEAALGEFPWQVSVRRTSFFGFSSTHRCGGALLNRNWVVTAGHCVDDLLSSQIKIRLGEHDFSSSDQMHPHYERGVSKKVVHPNYNFFTYENDLALVKLETPVNLTSHIFPICLPGNDDLLIGENATVTGWGRLSEGGQLPSKLQQVQVPIISNTKCREMFLKSGRIEHIPEIFMCAGWELGLRDSCQGDSGGPLQVRGSDGRWFLAGIISWGIGCAEPSMPGVCTRISKFTNWILKIVQND